ncbi:MAG: ribosome small subunit-dependent GTPase A [Planctomycetota bacterium]
MSDQAPLQGRVIRVDARQCEVELEGRILSARFRGNLFSEKSVEKSPVAVGDQVRLSREGEELAVEEVLPRRNFFSRRAAGSELRRQLIAANIDQVAVIASFRQPTFSSIATDRILAGCHFHEIPAFVVVNKADLARKEQLDSLPATYRAAGYSVLVTSALQGAETETLLARLKDRVTVLSGLSGVGKSSLLNRIEPGLGLRTRKFSQSLGSGRHTTAYARMFHLAAGGFVIDTPGMRSFRLFGIAPSELRLHLSEMAALGRGCHYPDCLHRGEPGCAVGKALKQGILARSRYRSYLEMLAELEKIYGGTGPAEEGRSAPTR